MILVLRIFMGAL